MTTKTIPQVPVQARDRLGTRPAGLLRRHGRLPAVIYGHKQDPQHVSVDAKQITDLLQEHTHIIEAVLDGGSQPCLVKDVQWDHLGKSIVHLDLTRVSLDERVEVEVELEFVGDAIGLKESGAYIEHPTASIEIECLATEIPSSIRADVSGLQVGDTLTVADLTLPAGVVAKTDAEAIVAAVHMSSAEEEEETAATPEEATGTEPEVIGRKAEEEGEEQE